MDAPTGSPSLIPGGGSAGPDGALRPVIAQTEAQLEARLNAQIQAAAAAGIDAEAIRGFEMASGSDGLNYVAWLTYTSLGGAPTPAIEVPLSISDVPPVPDAFIVCKSFAGSDTAARAAWNSALLEASAQAAARQGVGATFNVYVSRWALGGGANVGMLAILCLAVSAG